MDRTLGRAGAMHTALLSVEAVQSQAMRREALAHGKARRGNLTQTKNCQIVGVSGSALFASFVLNAIVIIISVEK